MTGDALSRLFGHMRWADTRAREALRDDPGALVERALELYCHVLGAEHIWLMRLRGEKPTVAVWPRLSVAEAARLADELHAGFDAYLAALDPGDFDRAVTYTNSAGEEFRSRAEDIMLHVVMHGSYHRGQVALLIRDGGGTPAPTDFIAFVRGAPAATRAGK
jgi:uncharacterized damage-inducible protein DinB